jgi:class 3 adenylate cyclase
VGYSKKTNRVDTQRVQKRVRKLSNEMLNPVVERGGTYDKSIGDALMFYFAGYPDDSARAVETALAMQKALKRYNRVLREEALDRLTAIAQSTNNVHSFLGRALQHMQRSDAEDWQAITDVTRVLERLEALDRLELYERVNELGMEALRELLERRDSKDELTEALIDLIDPLIFEMRIGIFTGRVTEGIPNRLEALLDKKSIIGDPANAAQRMEANCPPGCVLIGQSTADQLGDLFELNSIGKIPAKNMGLIPAYVVEGKRLAPEEERPKTGVNSAFRGRGKELAQMQAGFAAVLESKRPRMLVVEGEAGIGKSRLLHEFRTRVQSEHHDVLILKGFGEDTPVQEAYHVLLSALRRQARLQGNEKKNLHQIKIQNLVREAYPMGKPEELEREAQLLGYFLGVEFDLDENLEELLKDATHRRDLMFDTMLRFFRGLAQEHPVILNLDDMQWMDIGTLRVVRHILSEL